MDIQYASMKNILPRRCIDRRPVFWLGQYGTLQNPEKQLSLEFHYIKYKQISSLILHYTLLKPRPDSMRTDSWLR